MVDKATLQQYQNMSKQAAMGNDVRTSLQDDHLRRWYHVYQTYRQLTLVQLTVGTKTAIIVWPNGFNTLSSYYMNNAEAFAILSAFLRGEQEGICRRLANNGIIVVTPSTLVEPDYPAPPDPIV